ncbi:uncharacterized protein N7482_003417 [Penicillium canariense]|uniref:Uncharacterized protein n=1 Tax=Penicillium canariense TaxID=189055 RepID=A0A9W9I6M5_9EURO|nr:uncharacterized protein N7482_003417 [Penicillium canariense]KAJ5167823.1 hypothetical protein N7482_003417 [Penicillium canariense]
MPAKTPEIHSWNQISAPSNYSLFTLDTKGISTSMDEMAHDFHDSENIHDQLAQLTCDEFPFLVPVPTAGDDLEATAHKLSDLVQIISSGRPFALTTGQASTSKPSAEAFAKERMLATELVQYERWKGRIYPLPAFDWATNIRPVPEEALKTFSQRAAAMDIIWHHQGATPENAAWLSVNHSDLLPLVKAVTKVLSAKVHLEKYNPLSRLSETQIAEAKTLQLINAVVGENVERERARLRRVIECINQSRAVLRARLKVLGT